MFRSTRAILAIALLVLALPAQAEKELALTVPEFAQLEGVKELSTQRHFVRQNEVQLLLGWSEMRFQRAKLGGAAVFVVESIGEIVQPLKRRFVRTHNKAIYDAELGLIVLANAGEYRGKPVQETYRWEDGKLVYRRGARQKGKALSGSERPILSELLFLEKGRLEAGQKREVAVFDPLAKKVSKQTIEHVEGEWTLGEKPVEKFTSDDQGGITSYVRMDAGAALGTLAQSDFDKLPIVLLQSDASRAELSTSLMANPTVTNAVLAASREDWKVSKNKWTNKTLGVELRVPKKGWVASKQRRGFQAFFAESADKHGYAAIIVECVTPSVGFEAYVDLLVTSLRSEKTVVGEIARSKTRLGGHKGVRLTYANKSSATRTYAVEIDVVLVGERAIRSLRIQPADASTYEKDLEFHAKSIKIKAPKS